MDCRSTAGLLLFLAAATAARSGDDLPPEVLLLSRFKQKIRQDLARIPNYTCLETMQRFRRSPHSNSFERLDTVRLEVSQVRGKELFTYPGARRFEDRDVVSFVTGGLIGNGTFRSFAGNLFVSDTGTFRYHGEEDLDGHRATRFDFRVPQFRSGFNIRVGVVAATVAQKGSFWFDTASLDLLRLDVYGDEMPPELGVAESLNRIYYMRARIGDSEALLPKSAEVLLARFGGDANRNTVEFSNCHEYQTESIISFGPIPETTTQPTQIPRAVELPAGLMITVVLETAIDSKTSSVGDAIRARVIREVRRQGEIALPKAAVLSGRILRLERRAASSPFAIGIGFNEAEWEGNSAQFRGELIEINNNIATMQQMVTYSDEGRKRVLVRTEGDGVGIFYIQGKHFRIAPGLPMLWRTVAPDLKHESDAPH